LLGQFLFEQCVQGAQQSLLRSGLRCLAASQVCNDGFDLGLRRGGKRRLEIGNVGYAGGSLGKYLFPFEILQQGIESRVF
jgi:hypothetical protein